MVVKNTALCVIYFDDVALRPSEQAEIGDEWKKTDIFSAMVNKGEIKIVKEKKSKK